MRSGKLLAAVGILTLVTVAIAADPPEPPKVSSFAPLAEVNAQLDAYVEKIDAALATEEGFDEEKQGAVRQQANVVVALAQALAMHDEDAPRKAHAAAIVAAGRKLGSARGDFAAAKSALAEIHAALNGEATGEAPAVTWGRTASLGQIMNEAGVIHAQLGRNLDARRFAGRSERIKGSLVTLAVIGQAAILDTHEVHDETKLPEWYKYAAEFRDASHDVYAAIEAKDQMAAEVALERLTTNCEACHAVFHEE